TRVRVMWPTALRVLERSYAGRRCSNGSPRIGNTNDWPCRALAMAPGGQNSRRQDVASVAPPDEAPIKGAKYAVPQREEAFARLLADAKLVDELRKSAK